MNRNQLFGVYSMSKNSFHLFCSIQKEPVNRFRCDICDINLHRSILSKHNKSVKHFQDLERNERINIIEEDINDQVVSPKFFFPKENGGGPRYVDFFRLTDDMKVKQTDRQTRSHPENAYARVKITTKHNHETDQVDINKIVKMMCTRFAKPIQTYHYKHQTIVGCENLKFREDEPDERTNIPSALTQIVYLTKTQLNVIDPQ